MSQATRKLAKLVGTNIQERRKKLGLTQECLAEKIGVGQQSLSRMERGDIAPKLERLPDVAATLRCSVAGSFPRVGRGRPCPDARSKTPWPVSTPAKRNTSYE
ncbi:MAG: helix-turn-helix domain-containing protein [Desulfovibrio fairfieldensis]